MGGHHYQAPHLKLIPILALRVRHLLRNVWGMCPLSYAVSASHRPETVISDRGPWQGNGPQKPAGSQLGGAAPSELVAPMVTSPSP